MKLEEALAKRTYRRRRQSPLAGTDLFKALHKDVSKFVDVLQQEVERVEDQLRELHLRRFDRIKVYETAGIIATIWEELDQLATDLEIILDKYEKSD